MLYFKEIFIITILVCIFFITTRERSLRYINIKIHVVHYVGIYKYNIYRIYIYIIDKTASICYIS